MNRQGPEWERKQTAKTYKKYETGIPGSDDEDECK